MMTPSTTRIAYIEELSEALVDNPHDVSMKMHLRNVSTMDDAAFAAYRATVVAPADNAVVSLAEAREDAKRKRYALLVLHNFEAMEHADKRTFLERKAAAENASRQKL
jgi:hypothetical protein